MMIKSDKSKAKPITIENSILDKDYLEDEIPDHNSQDRDAQVFKQITMKKVTEDLIYYMHTWFVYESQSI